MKKFIAMMLCIVLVFSLVACGNNDEPTETTTEPTETTTAAPETTTEPTETTTEAPTEEITEEITDEISEELSFTFEYVTLDADNNFQPVEAPTEDMLFIQSLYEGIPVDQVPSWYVIAQIDPNLFEHNIFVPYVEGMEAVRSEAAMMSQAHSTVMLKVPEGTDVESLCADIKANANPRKWECVEAEMVEVVSSGNTILLVMADSLSTPILVDNFNAKMAG